MRTIKASASIPDGLACRLALHYAANASEPLAVFYWTGRVLPGTAARVERLEWKGEDSRGRRDPQAAAAELRALASYLDDHEGRASIDDWLKRRDSKWLEDYNLVVPWGWRGAGAE